MLNPFCTGLKREDETGKNQFKLYMELPASRIRKQGVIVSICLLFYLIETHTMSTMSTGL